jgi:Fe-S oxidoreductase
MEKMRLRKTGLVVSKVVMAGILIQTLPFEEAVKIVEKAIYLDNNYGLCEEKCPYGLPISEMIQENIEFYERLVSGRQ